MNSNVIRMLVVVSLISAISGFVSASDDILITRRDAPVLNPIDRFVLERLQEQHIEPSALCTDDEFIRRACLDVIGVIPEADDVKTFLADKSPNKRARLIDNLLDSKRYAEHFEVLWGDLLREHSVSKRKEGTVGGSYREWIRDALEKNIPYDQFARKLITASGTAEENPATNFYLRDMQNRVETVNTVAQVFMGTQMACAQCHDHPFDKWTQEDFHEMAAFFGRTNVSKAGKMVEISHVSESTTGQYRMPEGDGANKKKMNTGEVVHPVFPWNKKQKPDSSAVYRTALADYVTNNRQFAMVQANRLWRALMGRGIVEPPDDFRPKNPPTHPELLKYLTDEFIKAKLDNKALLRLILNSAAYQRSSVPTESNRSDLTLYSHRLVRRMTAEQIFDSLLIAAGYDEGLTEVPDVARNEAAKAQKKSMALKAKRKVPGVEWAADLPTPARNGSFMNVFNQPRRDVIAVTREQSGSIPQALEMMNGSALNNAIENSPHARELMDAKTAPKEIVTELYLATLSRYPTDAEISSALQRVDAANAWISDLQWALLNSREFAFVK